MMVTAILWAIAGTLAGILIVALAVAAFPETWIAPVVDEALSICVVMLSTIGAFVIGQEISRCPDRH